MDFDPPGSGDCGYWHTVLSIREARRARQAERTPESRATDVIDTVVAGSIKQILRDTDMVVWGAQQ